VPALVHLPVGRALTVRTAGDAFLESLGNPNTVRNYAIGIGKTAERLGETGRSPPWPMRRSAMRLSCYGAARRSIPGTCAALRWAPGWPGAAGAAMTPRPSRPGPSACPRLTVRLRRTRGWRSTG
jgi:hypothetical protein